MKKAAKFLLLILLLISKPIFSQEKINQYNSENQRNGLWKGYYNDSKLLRYEGAFNNGIETGLFTYYANTDKKTIMATRNFDRKNNAYTIFYDDLGNKVSEGNLKNKLRTGVWEFYHKNAKTIMSTENYVEDKLEGTKEVFYTNGKLAEAVNYKNNLKEGVSKKYSEDGKLLEEAHFKNGIAQGPYIIYDKNGQMVIKGNYKNDKKNGIWDYFSNGKMVKQVNTDTINGFKKPNLKQKNSK